MAERARVLRVLVASPGDVKAERALVPLVVEELNMGIAAVLGLRLEAIRWETDSYPGFHPDGPQGLIDTLLHIDDSDIVIGIFWKRFGTPTKEGATGTEHEIRRSWDAWKKNGRPQVMVYFSQKRSVPESPEETDQWGQVLRFRKNFPAEGLWWEYKSTGEFERLLRRHLTTFIRGKYQVPVPGAEAKSMTGAPLSVGPEAAVSDAPEAIPAPDAQEVPFAERSTRELFFEDQPEFAETPPRTDPYAPKRHIYKAESYALSGELTQPFSHVIKKTAFVKLSGEDEGWLSQKSSHYSVDGTVSFASAYNEVVESSNSEAWHTMATATLEKLNLLDVVTADRVVAKVWINVPRDENNSPKVNFFGTRFENLRINGAPVDPHLQAGVFAHDRTRLQKGEHRKGTLAGTMRSNLPCSRNSIVLPGLGTLFLCELLLDRDSYQLNMIRLAASSGYSGTITAVTCQASVGI